MASALPMSAAKAAKKDGKSPNLGHRTYYFNRELSWLEFNRRVLEEALDEQAPLLERAKFLSIFASNLDEFFMIRVSGLRRQLEAGTVVAPPDGMTPGEQVAAIHERLTPMLERQTRCWLEDVQPSLREAGIKVLDYGELKSKQRKLLRRHFKSEIYPALTPLAFDPGHPFPHISNLSINLAGRSFPKSTRSSGRCVACSPTSTSTMQSPRLSSPVTPTRPARPATTRACPSAVRGTSTSC